METAPHDYFWGQGFDGSGKNMLGKLLMKVRDELVSEVADKESHNEMVEMRGSPTATQ